MAESYLDWIDICAKCKYYFVEELNTPFHGNFNSCCKRVSVIADLPRWKRSAYKYNGNYYGRCMVVFGTVDCVSIPHKTYAPEPEPILDRSEILDIR